MLIKHRGDCIGSTQEMRSTPPGVLAILALLSVPLLYLAILIWNAEILAGAFQIGTDEHYEVTKAFLWSRGIGLYTQVWNDQPPLFTIALGIFFKIFGPTIGVARFVASFFGLSLSVACALFVSRKAGVLAGAIATFCLLASPEVLELSLSAMLEVPAVGTVLWAGVLLLCWQSKRWPFLLMFSGALVAIALQIKLTAVIGVPALMAEIGFIAFGMDSPSHIKGAIKAFSIWVSSVLITYALLTLMCGNVPWSVIIASHFSSAVVAHENNSVSLPFVSILCTKHVEALFGSAVGFLVLILRSDWRRMAFPLVWLATASVVHLYHRPWWPYYYLHFALPLAWLTGYGIATVVKSTLVKSIETPTPRLIANLAGLVVSCSMFGFVISVGERRLNADLASVRDLPRVTGNVLMAKMRGYADDHQWIYSQSSMHAFHARLPMIPELAVLPRKRFWSKQISDKEVLDIVKRYHPHELLTAGEISLDWTDWLATSYARVFVYGEYQLFVESHGATIFKKAVDETRSVDRK